MVRLPWGMKYLGLVQFGKLLYICRLDYNINRQMMKRLSFTIWLCLMAALAVTAQIQQGYVKTLGRPGSKGVALSGVTVRVKGELNAVVSKSDGTFSLMMPGKKNGHSFILQQVQKKGYELNDKDIIGRRYAFSTTVPLTLVMASTSQLQADKQRIENNAYSAAEKSYKDKIAKLEKQLSNKSITEERYRAAIQELQDKFERYQSLIESLADHYAHTDYDVLTEEEAEVNQLIEAGELEKAEALILTLFDPVGVLKRNKEALARLDQTIAGAQGVIDQAHADLAAVLKQQEKDAEYLYQLYTIAVAQLDNDQALHYIQTRAELDTTNIEWQLDAGHYIQDYKADYQTAISYFERGLAQARAQYGEQSALAATCYSWMGIAVFTATSDCDQALSYYYKARDIREKVLGEDHQETAQSWANIGMMYGYQGQYDQALTILLKALPVLERDLGAQHEYTITLQNNIGLIYQKQGNPNKALSYFLKSLAGNEQLFGKDHYKTGLTHNNLGSTYKDTGNYDKALAHHHKALEIFSKALGINHPSTAMSMNNLAVVYDLLNQRDKALEYYHKAVAVLEHALGTAHAYTALSYQNLGMVYEEAGNFDKAVEYYAKALSANERLYGYEHENTILALLNLGNASMAMENLNEALKYFNRALQGLEKLSGPYESLARSLREQIREIESMARH